MDIDFLSDLFDSFDVEVDDIDWNGADFNSVVYQIFENALRVAELDTDKHCENFSIYTNYLDSHLYIDGEEIHSLDELKEAVCKLNEELLEE